MLFKESEITNQVILENDLVAVLIDTNYVNIIKNSNNEVTGIVPNFIYDALVEDIKERKKTNPEKNSEDIFDETMFRIFDELGDFLSDIHQKAEPFFNDIKNDAKKINNRVKKWAMIDKLVKTRDVTLKEGVSTTGFIKKINNRILKLQEEIEKED